MDFIAIYKPIGPTSHDIVDQARRITGFKKVGHAGTLDPLAEGVLVLGLGREATKQLAQIVKGEKEYLVTIKLGEESSTDDAEGEKTIFPIKQPLHLAAVQKSLKDFVGTIQQIPPAYSAVKIAGRAAYKSARCGQILDLKPRAVEIKKIDLLDYVCPFLKLRVVTGPGVYIRSLARDLGRKLDVGGYVWALKRTRVGDFTEKDALTLEQLVERKTKSAV